MDATLAMRSGRAAAPSMPPGRVLRAYAADAWYEFLTALRAPAYAIPFLVLPIAVYLLFGVVMVGSSEGTDRIPGLADYLVCAFSVMGVMGPALVVGTVTLSAPRLIAMAAVLTVGAVPFGAMGLFLGAHFSGSASPAVVNLVYLPMLWLSGLFIPLPEALRPFAVIWPAFHVNGLAVRAAGLEGFSSWNPVSSAVVLVGVTVLFGALAIRRLERVG